MRYMRAIPACLSQQPGSTQWALGLITLWLVRDMTSRLARVKNPKRGVEDRILSFVAPGKLWLTDQVTPQRDCSPPLHRCIKQAARTRCSLPHRNYTPAILSSLSHLSLEGLNNLSRLDKHTAPRTRTAAAPASPPSASF